VPFLFGLVRLEDIRSVTAISDCITYSCHTPARSASQRTSSVKAEADVANVLPPKPKPRQDSEIFCHAGSDFPKEQEMNNPIQNEAETQELKREIPFRSAPKDETNERTSMSIKDPDTMLSMTVLLLACLVLAVLAHVVV
jgi:hypothetical protein